MLISQNGGSVWSRDSIVSLYIKEEDGVFNIYILTRDYEETLGEYPNERAAKRELRDIAEWKAKGCAKSYLMF